MRNFKLALLATICVLTLACKNDQDSEKMIDDKNQLNEIFPKGEKGPGETFTGNAYTTSLVESDSIYNTVVGNVYFEPGARSNWHSHPAGQILIITDGVGYHQIEGQPIEVLKKGSVVKCPPNVRHWHGASADVGLQQLYIVPNTDKGIVNWQERVTDEVYASVK